MNPGSNQLAGNKHEVRKIVGDSRIHLFLNKSDFINALYAKTVVDWSEANFKNFERVVWGEESEDEIKAHTHKQWKYEPGMSPLIFAILLILALAPLFVLVTICRQKCPERSDGISEDREEGE